MKNQNNTAQSAEKQSFLQKKNVEISFKRYAIDAMGAMALGLFASLLIGTIIKTLAENVGTTGLMAALAAITDTGELAAKVAGLSMLNRFCWILWQIGNYATMVTGVAMAAAIGYALDAPPLVLFSLCAVGQATNTLGGSGGPLAVLFVAILACEAGKLQLETLKEILQVPAVNYFEADIKLKFQKKRGILDVSGQVRAGLGLISVISLEPFDRAYKTDFAVPVNSFRSFPAINCLPLPVRITTKTSSRSS